jgi:hypothetical protein
MRRSTDDASKKAFSLAGNIAVAKSRISSENLSLDSEWWDETAPLYTDQFTNVENPFLRAFFCEEEAALRKVLKSATGPDKEPPVYIEVGSGTGRTFLELLEKQNPQDLQPASALVGIDFSRQMLKQSAKNLTTRIASEASWRIPWTLVQGDARRLDQILDKRNRRLRHGLIRYGIQGKVDDMLKSRSWVIGLINVLTNLSSKDSLDMLESVARIALPGDFIFASSYAAEHFLHVAYDLYTNPEVEKISGSKVSVYDTAKRVYASIDQRTGRVFKSHWLSASEILRLFSLVKLSSIGLITLGEKPLRVKQLENAPEISSGQSNHEMKGLLARAPFPRGVFVCAMGRRHF